MAYKSPELILNGKILKVTDTSLDEHTSFYLKIKFVHGEDWQLISGNNEFETFQSEATGEVAPIEHPFFLEYVTENIRGWPRILVEVWQVDQHGRHNINGYGTAGIPIGSGQYTLEIPCWRPKGTWYDKFIGAHSELQYPSIVCSSLNRYGLKTESACLVTVELSIIGRNFQLHGVKR